MNANIAIFNQVLVNSIFKFDGKDLIKADKNKNLQIFFLSNKININ
jgi:hypothetical protein